MATLRAFRAVVQKAGSPGRRALSSLPPFSYKQLFPVDDPSGCTGGDTTQYRKISGDYVEKVRGAARTWNCVRLTSVQLQCSNRSLRAACFSGQFGRQGIP